MSSYPYKTEPMKHQRYILEGMWLRSEVALLADMGTGKTKIILDEVGALHLYRSGDTYTDGLLVLCPKSLVFNWRQELLTHMSDTVSYRFASWTSTPNKSEAKALKAVSVADPNEATLHILIMNIEALRERGNKAEKLAEAFLKSHKCVMIVDESTFIKNPQAKRTKAAIRLGTLAHTRRILTGTAVEQSPLDAWSQFQFLRAGILGHDTFTAFKGCYAIQRDMEVGPKRFKIVVGYQRLEQLSARIAEHSFVIKKSQCLDLPPKVYKTVLVPLTPEQRRVYKLMESEALLELGGGALATAPEMITRFLRLHQICNGHMLDDDGKDVYFKTDRLKVLTDTILPGVSGSAVIWGHFVEPLRLVADAIGMKYDHEQVAMFTGDVTKGKRAQLVACFQDPTHPLRFLVANKTAAFGLTLTAADHMIYYTNQWSPDVRIQSEDRAHRKGQDKSVTYIDMIAPDTIEMVIAQALKKKASVAKVVMSDGLRGMKL